MKGRGVTGGRFALLADIGGTNTRFGLAGPAGGVTDELTVRTAEFDGPGAAVRHYLEQIGPARAPAFGALAVAAPVSGDTVELTNGSWRFSIESVRTDLGLDALYVLNDFTAIALAVPRLGTDDRLAVGDGTPVANTPIAVIGPGTGLGVSGLVPSGTGWTPLAHSEGGHVTLAPSDQRESEVLSVLRRRFGHVSAERVLSGPGLINLYRALCEIEGADADEEPTADAITARAQAGTCPRSTETLTLFCTMLGTAAADLALTLGARSGVYIAGGIVPRLGKFFTDSPFRQRFQDKGRFSEYLAGIPVWVVTHPRPAFPGLVALLEDKAAREPRP